MSPSTPTYTTKAKVWRRPKPTISSSGINSGVPSMFAASSADRTKKPLKINKTSTSRIVRKKSTSTLTPTTLTPTPTSPFTKTKEQVLAAPVPAPASSNNSDHNNDNNNKVVTAAPRTPSPKKETAKSPTKPKPKPKPKSSNKPSNKPRGLPTKTITATTTTTKPSTATPESWPAPHRPKNPQSWPKPHEQKKLNQKWKKEFDVPDMYKKKKDRGGGGRGSIEPLSEHGQQQVETMMSIMMELKRQKEREAKEALQGPKRVSINVNAILQQLHLAKQDADSVSSHSSLESDVTAKRPSAYQSHMKSKLEFFNSNHSASSLCGSSCSSDDDSYSSSSDSSDDSLWRGY